MEGITTIQSDSFWDLSTNETSIEIPSSVTYIGEMPFLHSSFDEIIVRGKSSAPSEFSTDWDCVATSSGETYDKCTKYANVEYRP